jgi:large subunit ribosomal protein L24
MALRIGRKPKVCKCKVHVKTGDVVLMLSGKDKGKKGKILAVSRREGKVIVEKLNMITKHVKPTKVEQEGGRVKAESAVYACKVQLVCPQCGEATRIAHSFLEDGTKKRMCKKCKKAI